MILLKNYIIDTGGLLEPWMIMLNKKCYNKRTNIIFSLKVNESNYFENINNSFHYYKMSLNYKEYKDSDYIYVLDRIGKILYLKGKYV